MKQVIILIAVFLTLQANGQKYDYLGILNSMPAIPENTLTANEAEIESYKMKLSRINDLLWDLENEQKEQQRKKDNERIPFNVENMDKIEEAQEGWDKLYTQLTDVTTPIFETRMEIVGQWRADQDSLMKVNEPYFKQIQLLNNGPDNAGNRQIKKQVSKQIYTNRLNAYRKLDARNRDNLQKMMSEYKKLAPLVKKLDNYSVEEYQFSNGSTGLTLLRDVYTSMEGAYFYNAEDGGKMNPFDASQLMRQMFPGNLKDN